MMAPLSPVNICNAIASLSTERLYCFLFFCCETCAFNVMPDGFFIRPKSDRCLPLSPKLTALTNSCCWDLIDVTLADEVGYSELVNDLTWWTTLVEIFQLKFGQYFEAEICPGFWSWPLAAEVWAKFLVEIVMWHKSCWKHSTLGSVGPLVMFTITRSWNFCVSLYHIIPFYLMYANPLYHEQTKHNEFCLRHSQGLELLWGFLANISIFPETGQMTGHSFYIQEKIPTIFFGHLTFGSHFQTLLRRINILRLISVKRPIVSALKFEEKKHKM